MPEDNKIEEARKALGLTQWKLAKGVGVSINTIDKWEKGISTPTPENRKKLLEVLQIKEI